MTVEKLSNYTGSRSGCQCKLLIASSTGAAIIQEIKDGELDLDYLSSLEYTGGYIVQ